MQDKYGHLEFADVRKSVWIALLLNMLFRGLSLANWSDMQIEKKMLKYIASDEFGTFQADQRCRGQGRYRVYLIDNFEQDVDIVPEVRTSHGEMLSRLLQSGRNDIAVVTFNTSLSKGLAQIIDQLRNGACIDAIISSTPGSNYTYDQIGSLFDNRAPIDSHNILAHRSALKKLMRDIAFDGFPSVEWLRRIDVNPVKLRNDARKYVFIEALGRFNVPVILPYGNADATYKGKIKSVNLLSLASNAKVFSALNQNGERVPGFPYSPLSSGDEQAVYNIVECPDPENPFRANLDINGDGHYEYSFVRSGRIAYHDDQERLSFAPPVLSPQEFALLLAQNDRAPSCRIDKEIVLTARQYRVVKSECTAGFDPDPLKSFVWLNSSTHGRFFDFEAQCWNRGEITGTSVIPPNKVKELLPLKAHPSRQMPGRRSGRRPGCGVDIPRKP